MTDAPADAGTPTIGPGDLVPITDADLATLREKELSGSTPLSDCPEVLKFYKQPQVQRFEEKYFGYGPDDNVWFRGGCPSLETVQKSYAEAQQRVAQGLVK